MQTCNLSKAHLRCVSVSAAIWKNQYTKCNKIMMHFERVPKYEASIQRNP